MRSPREQQAQHVGGAEKSASGTYLMDPIDPSEVTSARAYLSRREFVRRTGIAALGAMAFGACRRRGLMREVGPEDAAPELPTVPALPTSTRTDELGNPVTLPYRMNTYGNYYEFTRDRLQMGEAVGDYEPPPLRIEVGGLVEKPRAFGTDELMEFGQEERIYRQRCIEAWAMVVPWTGFPLSRLLEAVVPLPQARFVRFESVYDPENMPGQRPGAYDAEAPDEEAMGARAESPYVWPYAEGLRLDEAMHDLTFLATGMYGGEIHPANGAPARVLVPWKYTFKSPKAVVKIDLVADRPATFWNTAIPEEYGFYANVNPNVPHPYWEQVKEVRYRGACPEPIVPTLMFNGYADQVAHLYEGMDLRENY